MPRLWPSPLLILDLCTPGVSINGLKHQNPLQVDPSVSAIVHYVRSLYYKQQRDFAEFYMSSLLYLAFISMDSLPEDQKLVWLPVLHPGPSWVASPVQRRTKALTKAIMRQSHVLVGVGACGTNGCACMPTGMS